jgi:hypothetical protein
VKGEVLMKFFKMETQCEDHYPCGTRPNKRPQRQKMIKKSQHKQKDDEFISKG